jgi:CBS domain-containing protein
MTRNVQTVHPNDTLRTAAQIMGECDIGFLPVGARDRLIGMITDRDIAVRAMAAGYGPSARVGDLMTRDVKYCYDDEDLDDVLDNMSAIKVRRLPVLNRNKRLVGVLSLTDAALEGAASHVGTALSAIGRPGGAHTQTPIHAGY